ncbi:MAG: protein kinase domain-containing protein, partial [Verrucomicrobiaceae bacterium]
MAFPIDITRESNSPEHLQFQVGQRVFNKRYELIEMIGSGGMGFIWRAFDQVGQKDVALKFLPTILVHHPKEMDRLRKEVDAGQKLRHDLIVATHGLEVEGALAAIVMEFVQGETLKQKLEGCERGFFEPAEIEPWFNDIVSALGYLHGDKALLHRDIKPANIIVDEKGRARLLDFGISQTLQETMGRHTQTGAAQSTSNTLAYASPESLELGHKPAITDDIYSLGATVYELLTGTPPFYQGTPAIIALHIVKTPVPSVMQRRAELVEGGMNKTVGQPVDARWQALVSACLAKEPAQRPQSVKALDWRTAKVVESFSSRDEASGDAVREGPLPSSVPPMRSAPAPQKAPPPAERHGLKPEITFAARFTKRVAILSVGVLAAYAFWPQSTTPRTDEPAKEVLVVKEVPKEIIKEVPVKDPDTERKLAEMQNANEELRKKLAEVPKPAPTPPPQPKPPRAEIVQEPSLIERLTTQGNSLGMKFVTFASLNGGKLSVLGCEHETRSKDFAIFFADPQRVSFYKDTVHAEVSDAGQWRTFVYRDSPVGRSMAERAEDSEHCVVKVSWLDAQAFCAWLTERERWAGLIGP